MEAPRSLFAIVALVLLSLCVAVPPADAQQALPPLQGPPLSPPQFQGPAPAGPQPAQRVTPRDRDNRPESQTLDFQGPRVSIVRPSHGSVVPTATPLVVVSFAGLDSAVDPGTLRVFINGIDLSSEFLVTGTDARFQVGPDRALPEGENTIRALISDRSGRVASVLSAFTVVPPGAAGLREKSPVELWFTQPLPTKDYGAAPHPQTTTLSRELTQFGYDLFTKPASTFAPVTDVPVGGDYIIGPGDTLILKVWGISEVNAVLPVDRRGEVFIPSMEPVQVWGLSLTDVERGIKAVLSRYLESFQFSVSLGELRTIQIFVVGEVMKPGTYTISSLATAINALMAAGGPTKQGSLRNVKVMRQGRVVRRLDLYAYLLAGDDSQDQRLRSGDTIFVPPIGPVVAIAGSVRRPGIYELNGSTKLADLVQMAGGLTPAAYLQQVQIERVVAYQSRSILDVDFSQYMQKGEGEVNIDLRDGDFVMIFSIPASVPDRVTLEGFVKHPGRYELKSGMRLRDILTSDQLLPDAYRGRIEIVRLRQDFSTEIVAVDAGKLLRGDTSQDIPLRRLDRIIVNSEVRQPESVTLKGEVKRPGIYPIAKGELLSSVLRRAGGFTDRAFLKGAVFTRESSRRIERAQVEDFIKNQEQRLLAEASTVVVAGVEKEELGIQERLLTQRRELLRALADKVTLGRVVLRLDALERFEGSAPDIPLEDGDMLMVPSPPSSVFVLGSVRAPASILYKPGERGEYYLSQAGGLTREADEGEIYLMKADGSAIPGFIKLQQVEPGDTILVPAKTQVIVRPVSIFRDIVTILGQTALTIAAIAAIH